MEMQRDTTHLDGLHGNVGILREDLFLSTKLILPPLVVQSLPISLAAVDGFAIITIEAQMINVCECVCER